MYDLDLSKMEMQFFLFFFCVELYTALQYNESLNVGIEKKRYKIELSLYISSHIILNIWLCT